MFTSFTTFVHFAIRLQPSREFIGRVADGLAAFGGELLPHFRLLDDGSAIDGDH